MNKLTGFLLVLLLIGFTVGASADSPKGGDKQSKTSMKKTMSNDKYDYISVNNCLMWMSNNGNMSHNPSTDASGFEWPKSSAHYVIFQDGLVWGGTVQGEIRCGGSTFRNGLQAGPILADGTAAPAADPRYRVYKVRKLNADTYSSLTTADQDRFKTDFMEWPVADGAPWVDADGDGQYQPNFNDYLSGKSTDSPKFIGDEVLWFVSNDLDASRTTNLYGTAPVGLEVHTMVWAYNQTGPLGNIVFTKYTVINKGTNDFENVYFSKWSDPDLGDANDDYVGIDTTLSLGFVYNGYANDGIYGVPPAAGYDFFQGPIVRSPGNVAHWNFGLKEGYRNLPVSTFAFYINGNSIYTDPDLGTTQGALMMYNYQKGLRWNGSPYIDPTTGLNAKVCLAGDPITKTGWVDGILHAPGDRRFLMTSGPFTLAKGDSQEVVVATIVGRGSDRLSSLQVLKYYDRFAQLAFDNNFDLPKAPPVPKVNVSLQDKKITLYWGDPKACATTENYIDRGYKFEGYNIYQFASKSSLLSEGKRLATYDIINDVTTIFDEQIDPNSGAVIELPVQFGTDVGVAHMYEITKDALLDKPLVNNQPYYFAVTTYSYNNDPEATPRQLESAPTIIEVRPQTTDPGYRYGVEYNGTISTGHVALVDPARGLSTGKVLVTAIDPLQLTGHTYEVTFSPVGTVDSPYDADADHTPDTVLSLNNYAAWNLYDINAQTMLVDKSDKFVGGEADYYTIDGFKIGIRGSGFYQQYKILGDAESGNNEILSREWIGGTQPYCPHNGETDCTGGDEWEPGYLFMGSSIPGYDVKKTIEIRFSKTVTSKGYMYLRGGTPNYGYQGYYPCYFTVWDISDANNPRQLQFAWVEQKGTAANDNTWAPTTTANDREYLFILDETYTDTPLAKYTSLKINTGAASMPILYASWYIQRQEYGTKTPWREGNIWRITPNVSFSDNDKYTFTTPAPSYDSQKAKEDIVAVNVFPNPYVGANAQELNKYQRFVNFNHLPKHAKFRIYTLAGTLVKSFEKNDATQYAKWDLNNQNGLPVGSGMYIIHIDMPEIGAEKILKLGVIMETQYLDRI